MRVEQKRLWFPLCAIGFGLALGVSGCAKRAVTTQGAGQVAPPAPQVEKAPPAPSPEAARPQPSPTVRERGLQERSREQVAKELSGGMPAAAQTALIRIHFDFDKYTLTPEAMETLRKNAEWLRKNPNVKILIDGNADERGTNEYNLALGEKRAHSAKEYLVQLGIPADRLSTISYGEERPLDPQHNEEAWAKNRRDGFHPLER